MIACSFTCGWPMSPTLPRKQKLDALSRRASRWSIELADIYDLGQEFFRWEIATAVAGSIIGINPFNQPDVEASKMVTRKLTAEYEKTVRCRRRRRFFEKAASSCSPTSAMRRALKELAGSDTLAGICAPSGQLKPGDYFALLATSR